ncbi:unnamed protein product [Pleuronectes platessa]|uniref:Uncharacterized protein n=1 Tax=Pleuronectes platessa TaxID=8262 RepID=A0A9N7VWE0_PLEPL|nr:unnamed protein product [Pleuronectes platessa]
MTLSERPRRSRNLVRGRSHRADGGEPAKSNITGCSLTADRHRTKTNPLTFRAAKDQLSCAFHATVSVASAESGAAAEPRGGEQMSGGRNHPVIKTATEPGHSVEKRSPFNTRRSHGAPPLCREARAEAEPGGETRVPPLILLNKACVRLRQPEPSSVSPDMRRCNAATEAVAVTARQTD